MIDNRDYESIVDNPIVTIFENDMQNSMQIIIAEYIGTIATNYSIEYKQISAFKFYPPLNSEQLRKFVIEKLTSIDVKKQLAEHVFQRIELKFSDRINQWNTLVKTTAKKYILNVVEDAVDSFREKLLQNQQSNITIQRFVLVKDLLKLI